MSSSGFFTVNGLHPSGNGQCEFKIAAAAVEALESHGPVQRFHDLKSAVEVLKSPLMIFEGLKRYKFRNGLCYIGKPRAYRDGWEGPQRPNMLFMVCMTERFAIFEWGWEKSDSGDEDVLEDTDNRFERLKWKRS